MSKKIPVLIYKNEGYCTFDCGTDQDPQQYQVKQGFEIYEHKFSNGDKYFEVGAQMEGFDGELIRTFDKLDDAKTYIDDQIED